MSDTTNSGKRRGCAPILVFMIGFLFLIFGVLAGAGGLYGYLYSSEDGLERLRLAEFAEPDDGDTTEEVHYEVYALAYPLLETLDTHSSLDERAIRSHINQHRDLLQQCYTDELSRDGDTRGEIDLQFSIHGQTGEVAAAVIRDNRTGSEELGRCLTRNIQREWSFSAPDTPGVATVRFHTLFLPLQAH